MDIKEVIMDPIFKKMQYKSQSPILVLNAPPSFEPSLQAMREVTTIVQTAEEWEPYSFYLNFVQSAEEIAAHAKQLEHLVETDGLLWFAYPKKSSKKYKTNISRDHGWQPLGDLGFEGVRMVAIDEDWSALRFRKAEHIKTMTRKKSFAMSKAGKAKTTETC